jgi:dihydroxyacetone kinase-like protein
MELTLDQALAWVRRFAEEIHENKEYLTRLDAAIGDGDHGINMDRGFQAVHQKLEAAQPGDLGALFKVVGSTLISTVGGASGPLYGTAFLRMGGALAGRLSAGAPELGTALTVAYDGVAARGKSGRGEKTMLDALGSALDAFQAAQSGGQTLLDVARAAAAAAEEGMKGTIPMLATKGRASFLGENSIGHQDPGATSTWLFFRALSDTVRPDESAEA